MLPCMMAKGNIFLSVLKWMSNVKFLYDNCFFYCFYNSFMLDLVTANFVSILPCYTDVFCRIQAVAMLIGFF